MKRFFRMHPRYATALSLALVLALLATPAMDVEAKWTRTHAFHCKTLGGIPMDTAYGLHNDSSDQDMIALCAIADTSDFMKGNIKTLNVHGYAGHRAYSMLAMSCNATFFTAGGFCGAQASSNPYTGDVTLSPYPQAVWPSHDADFGYLWVLIPRKDGSTRSSFRGYYTAD
jgi:hypothetical protein